MDPWKCDYHTASCQVLPCLKAVHGQTQHKYMRSLIATSVLSLCSPNAPGSSAFEMPEHTELMSCLPGRARHSQMLVNKILASSLHCLTFYVPDFISVYSTTQALGYGIYALQLMFCNDVGAMAIEQTSAGLEELPDNSCQLLCA